MVKQDYAAAETIFKNRRQNKTLSRVTLIILIILLTFNLFNNFIYYPFALLIFYRFSESAHRQQD